LLVEREGEMSELTFTGRHRECVIFEMVGDSEMAAKSNPLGDLLSNLAIPSLTSYLRAIC